MKRGMMRRLAMPAVVVLLALGIGFGSGKNGHGVYAALAGVPAKARAMRNPEAGKHTAIAAGKKLFARHCAECHGEDGGGGRRGPSLRVAPVRDASPGAVFWVLSNGVVRRGMPDWSKLPAPELWQIVTFVQSLPPAARQTPGGRGRSF